MGAFGPDDMVDLCKYGIGWETSIYELMLVGERRINMMRYYNAREGLLRKMISYQKECLNH